MQQKDNWKLKRISRELARYGSIIGFDKKFETYFNSFYYYFYFILFFLFFCENEVPLLFLCIAK